MPVTAEPHKPKSSGNKEFFAEVIYENGEHSISAHDDESELVEALKDHHNRAKNALPIHNSWGPNEKPIIATRIVAAHLYDSHPADVDANTITAENAQKRMKAAFENVDGDSVNVYDLHAALTPQVLVEGGPHDSNYAQEPVKSLNPSLWA